MAPTAWTSDRDQPPDGAGLTDSASTRPAQRGFLWTLAAGTRTLRLEPTEAASDASHQTYCHAKAITITSTAINKPSCAQKLSAKLRPFVLSLWIVMGDDLPLGRHLEMVASKQMLMNGKER